MRMNDEAAKGSREGRNGLYSRVIRMRVCTMSWRRINYFSTRDWEHEVSDDECMEVVDSDDAQLQRTPGLPAPTDCYALTNHLSGLTVGRTTRRRVLLHQTHPPQWLWNALLHISFNGCFCLDTVVSATLPCSNTRALIIAKQGQFRRVCQHRVPLHQKVAQHPSTISLSAS